MSFRRDDLPPWAKEIIALYESDSANQFVLYGNIHDRFLLGREQSASSGSLIDFLQQVLMPGFDVVLSYDRGNGRRVERGGEKLKDWPAFQLSPALPRAPRAAIEFLTRYMRYCSNLA